MAGAIVCLTGANAKGLPFVEIGQQLEISPPTAESTRAYRLEKAQVKSPPELIEFVFNNGIINPRIIKN
jgi:FixJ family two-component response regulator